MAAGKGCTGASIKWYCSNDTVILMKTAIGIYTRTSAIIYPLECDEQ